MENPENVGSRLRAAARRHLSIETRRRIVSYYLRLSARPPVGLVRFGSLRRLTPISENYGFDRGTPIDRYYIDDFLDRHAGRGDYSPGLVRGVVLEVGEAYYSRRLANFKDVEKIDVLDVSANNPAATVVADLTDADQIPSDVYDCVICTQTLLLIYEVRAAIATLERILKPGGTLLVTVPGISASAGPTWTSGATTGGSRRSLRAGSSRRSSIPPT